MYFDFILNKIIILLSFANLCELSPAFSSWSEAKNLQTLGSDLLETLIESTVVSNCPKPAGIFDLKSHISEGNYLRTGEVLMKVRAHPIAEVTML